MDLQCDGMICAEVDWLRLAKAITVAEMKGLFRKRAHEHVTHARKPNSHTSGQRTIEGCGIEKDFASLKSRHKMRDYEHKSMAYARCMLCFGRRRAVSARGVEKCLAMHLP